MKIILDDIIAIEAKKRFDDVITLSFQYQVNQDGHPKMSVSLTKPEATALGAALTSLATQ